MSELKLKSSPGFKSERAFREALEKYFSSVAEQREGGEGTVFRTAPSLPGLRVALGLTGEEWAECERRFPKTAALAKNVIEAYLEDELIKRKTGVTGIMFSLQSNFGWKEKRDPKAPEDMEVTIRVV